MPQTKTISWYIKTAVISLLLLIQTYIIGTLIETYINKADYFNLSSNNDTYLYTGLLLFSILLTYSLSIGGWNKIEQYFYIPLSMGIGMALVLLKHNLYNGIATTIILMLLVAYNVYKATTLKGLLIKFEPKFILDTSLKGLIIVYSIFAVTILMLGKTDDTLSKINVGEKITEIAKKPIEDIQKATGLQELQNIQSTSGISELDMNGLQNIEGLQGLSFLNAFNTDATVVVENQINNMLLPYKSFFKPIMAIFIYLTFSFIWLLSYYLCILLLNPVFKLAKILKFIKIQKAMVEQEIPSF